MSAPQKENGDVEVDYEIKDDVEPEAAPSRCDRCQESCIVCLKPILADYNPTPLNPDCLQRFKFAFCCPPHGKIGAAFFVVLVGAIWWGTLWALTDKEALPGGNLFSLFVLFFLCWCGGYIVNLVKLPPLLGMLLIGGLLGNVPGFSIAKDIKPEWSAGCRQMALAIILIRAGLGLDPAALKRLSFVVLRLAFSPCLAETLVDAIAAHLILGFPWVWGFMLGFIIAAVSPAVVVPSLLSLSERGYGLDKGVPTLVIAAASLDDVLAITGFGVLLGITFSKGDLAWNLFKGPLEAIVGVTVGIVLGVILWYFPQKKSKHQVLFRSAMVVGAGMLSLFGSKRVGWSGAGPLAVLTLAFVAAYRWRQEMPKGQKNPMEDIVGVLWMIFQPLLFGLIGAAVQIDHLSAETVGEGIAVLCIGLTVRCLVAFLAVFGTNFNMKERLFIPLAWLPKATVQAAIGAIAYDTARERGDKDLMVLGEKCLQLAVLSILLTAPTGAGLIAITGPFFLSRTPDADRLRRKSELSVDDDQDIENNDHGGGGSLDDAGTISKGGETNEVFLADACVDGVGFGRTASSQPAGKNKMGNDSQNSKEQGRFEVTQF